MVFYSNYLKVMSTASQKGHKSYTLQIGGRGLEGDNGVPTDTAIPKTPSHRVSMADLQTDTLNSCRGHNLEYWW